MPSPDDNKRSKRHTHLLLLTIFGQTVIMSFACGFTGGILFEKVIPLPDHVVRLIVEYPTELTLIVTLISTALSMITSGHASIYMFFTFAVKEALRHHLSGPMTLFKLRTAIALSRPSWVLRWKYLKLSALTLVVFAMIGFLNSSWSTLLLPTLIQWPVELTGTELNLGSVAFTNQLNDDLIVLAAENTQEPAFQTFDALTLISGVSAMDTEADVQTSSIFNFNGVSYNRSTGGVLPAVSEYAGSSNTPSAVGLYFSGGLVPVHYSLDWGRDWAESDFQGITKNYTVTQQGFTANVTCQGIDRSVDSFSVTPNATQGPLNSIFLIWEAVVNCSGNLNSATYLTFGNATGQFDPTMGFLPALVCPDPGSTSFNPFKFDIFMASVGKYHLPTTVCEVVPYMTTVNVTYNRAIISVDQVGISSDLTSSPSLPLAQYIASAMNYQVESSQTPVKNLVGDLLTMYGNNDTTLMYSQLEDYWRGILEFTSTQLRSGYSAAGQYSSNEIPSNMTVSTQGTMYITTYGWDSNHRTFSLVIVVITTIWGVTVLAAAHSLIKEKYSFIDTSFDFSDPVHLIVAAAAGGLQGSLHELGSNVIEDREDLTVQFVDVYDKEGKRASRKLQLVDMPV
ncbi:hypothetical protein K503DRAFT_865091 [Rhizopogon vinicolor AM-OR11-026]|uniref:Uncharacterized protein n=1 Tax=Rhizopogon vinicolor AM-OR11-026 TaxID=1314800 RepID=A0A1B7N4T9_9AGAM|nr:hypothetical protein K503DRAFT_865091 [Rhizopogon vinicolor AM-OR11-026]